MVFYWERFLKPRSTALALPLCCITAIWQGEVETELCQLPLHVGRILLVLSIMSPTRAKFRMNKYNYKSFDPTMMTNRFWLNLYNRACFFPNCASAAQEFRAKFFGTAKTGGSEMLICKQPGIYIIAHYCDCHCLQLCIWGLAKLAKIYRTLKTPLHLNPEHLKKLRRASHVR